MELGVQYLWTAISTWLLCSTAACSASPEETSPSCYRFPLEEMALSSHRAETVSASLGWAQSGVWDEEGLTLVDLGFRRLARVPIKQEEAPVPGIVVDDDRVLSFAGSLNRYEVQSPLFVYPRMPGFLLLDEELDTTRSLLFVKEHDEIESIVGTGVPLADALANSESARRFVLINIGQAVPLGKGVIAHVVLEGVTEDRQPGRTDFKADRGRWSGFAYLETGDSLAPDDRTARRYWADLDFREGPNGFFVQEMPRLAATTSAAYVVLLSEGRIGRIDAETLEASFLDRMPADFDLPVVESAANVDTQQEVVQEIFEEFRFVESQRMMVGLFAWEEHLFALGKGAATMTETAWWLIELDPKTGEELKRISLPTKAGHITFVPGPKYTAIIEKGWIDLVGSFVYQTLYRRTLSGVLLDSREWLGRGGRALAKVGGGCVTLEPVPSRREPQ